MKKGLYYSLLNRKLGELLVRENLKDLAELINGESQDVARIISHELADNVRKYLEDELKGPDDLKQSATIVEAYFKSDEFKELLESIIPVGERPQVLTEIKSVTGSHNAVVMDGKPWVGRSSLIVPGVPGPQLIECLRRELKSCDQVEWLVSFLKTSGVNEIYEELQEFCRVPRSDGKPKLKIATTTYIGASDIKAIRKLMDLPNTEIRMSYDSLHQRLHAKAYLFHRDNGFSTAYIGSANLSSVAVTTGLEWTSKITQWEMPHLWASAKSAFLKSWENDDEFKRKTLADIDEISAELMAARGGGQSKDGSGFVPLMQMAPRPYQLAVLEDIAQERIAARHRHLVVAATGTGKTMMAAFDMQRLKVANGGCVPSMLYIVHRQDILRQVRAKYRAVLRDANFGVILPDEDVVGNNTRHVFCTPASWKSKVKDRWPHKFDAIIIDECHHAAAKSYDDIIAYYANDIDAGISDLLGLTATPDREDGADIRVQFGGTFTHELSLAYAINEQFLVPYRYMLIEDNVDFSSVNWRNKAQSESQIAALLEGNRTRAEKVFEQVVNYVADEHKMRAVGFCAGVSHAEFMAQYFNEKGIPAVALSGQSTPVERNKAIERLNASDENRINVIFTADLFNEGVDLPNVDTLLMLRPTNSLTIYTQQLGRGLRLPEYGYDKTSLLVLDFVSDQNCMFDETMRFRVLTGHTGGSIIRRIQGGMFVLPSGCTVTMTSIARQIIISNINNRIRTLRGQQLVSQVLQWIRDHGSAMSLFDLLQVLADDDAIRLIAQTKSIPSELSKIALNTGNAMSLKEQEKLAKLILRLNQTDDYKLLSKWRGALEDPAHDLSEMTDGDIFKFSTCMDFQKVKSENYRSVWDDIRRNPDVCKDIADFLKWKLSRAIPQPESVCEESNGLVLHAKYSRTQITQELGHSMGYLPQSGVVPVPGKRVTAFFVTRVKSESEFTPETMYKDFAITPEKFKWDSQNRTKVLSDEAQSYINGTCTPLLFIQEHKTGDLDIPEGFTYLGPLEYISHEGEAPISFEWKLKYPMPARVFQWAQL